MILKINFFIKNFKIAILPILFLVSVSYSQGLRNTHHDFSDVWGGDDICKPCHIPKEDKTLRNVFPLWEKDLSTKTHKVIKEPKIEDFNGEPTGVSKLCLTCHDGTYGRDSHRVLRNSTETNSVQGMLTNKVTTDHPISFLYDSNLAKQHTSLYDPSTTASGLGNTIEKDLLKNKRVECTSCHDIHAFRNFENDCTACHVFVQNKIVLTSTLSLWKSNEQSALCLICHKK